MRSTLSRAALFVVLMLSALSALQAQVPQGGTHKFGASAIWQPPQDFVTKAHAVCDKSSGPMNFSQCFIIQMVAADAPADTITFTRMLYKQMDGQVGIMAAFKNLGPVDAAQVLFPLRANDNYGLLLINGDPAVLDVDDMQKLDQAAMQQDPLFRSVKSQFPDVAIWPGDRSAKDSWPRVQPLPNGGTELIVTYPLINGCHACRRIGQARYGWDFDASGKFLKTVYIPTPPPPKLLKRPHSSPMAQPPQATQEPQQSEPPAQPPAPPQNPQ
jgi:hypothetical protein